MCRAEPADVPGRVHVPVVPSTTLATLPVPCREPSQTLRTGQRSAFGAPSRGVRLVHFPVEDPGLPALVVEEPLEAGPRRIERRLGHLGPDELGARHVADVDLAVLADELRRELVQLVGSHVPDLRVQGAHLLEPTLMILMVVGVCTCASCQRQGCVATRTWVRPPRRPPTTPPSHGPAVDEVGILCDAHVGEVGAAVVGAALELEPERLAHADPRAVGADEPQSVTARDWPEQLTFRVVAALDGITAVPTEPLTRAVTGHASPAELVRHTLDAMLGASTSTGKRSRGARFSGTKPEQA